MRVMVILINDGLPVDLHESSAGELTHIRVLLLICEDGVQYRGNTTSTLFLPSLPVSPPTPSPSLH